MKTIDVFDFDKTLYKKDSTVQFYLFCLSKYKKIIKHLPRQFFSFILYKLKIKSKVYFKENFFIFLKDIDEPEKVVKEFWNSVKEKDFRKEILEKNINYKIVISASPEFLLKEKCKELGIDYCIATIVDIKTGKFISKNCKGPEKVERLNEFINDYKIENFYSDSLTDKYLAKLAKNSYLIKNGKIILSDYSK